MTPRIYIVVPCYNETEALPDSAAKLSEKCRSLISDGSISPDSRILLVDDGSTDGTWELIRELNRSSLLFEGIKLSHNRGHQNALLAGLMTALEQSPDAVISIDADLQDDINAIDGMLKELAEGCDVVYGVRAGRQSDTFMKRFTAEAFYKTLKSLGVETVFNHADCRLVSKRALEALAEYKEVNLYLRGIIPQIGYKSSVVEYDRKERQAGESKYNIRKMLRLAMDGITGFSAKPITMLIITGAVFALIGLLGMLTFVILALASIHFADALWIAGAIVLMGGLQLFGTGLVGEYVGRTYFESKARPRYIIEDALINDSAGNGNE